MRKDRWKEKQKRQHLHKQSAKGKNVVKQQNQERRETKQPSSSVTDVQETGQLIEGKHEDVISGAVTDDVTEHQGYVSRFSRRKVESNWDRYEGLPPDGDDDNHSDVQMRGSDFHTLIKQSGAASSQFRFEDEKDWEEQEETIEMPSNVLSLDIDSLSASLNTIPLHRRLQIEEEIFQPRIIKRFQQEAAEFEQKSITASLSRTKHIGAIQTLKDSTQLGKQSTIIQNTDNKSGVIAGLQSTGLSEVQKEQIKCEIGRTVIRDEEFKQDNVEEKPWLQAADDEAEDDLDFLLSLETPISHIPTEIMKNDEEIKDEYSKSETKDDTSATVKDTSQSLSVNQNTKPESSVDIDDWLDSILDD